MKPVAWGMLDKDGGIYDSISPEEHDREEGVYDIPLYTHPAKTLTDEEIRHLQAQCHLKNVGYDTFIMRFARAILKKASEK
jgi:hypothetical protein